MVLCATLLALFAASPAWAAEFEVTEEGDPAPDGCSPGDCSLREAIIASNAAADADEINLPAGAYELSIAGVEEDAAATGDLDITGDLTINGAGAGSTTVNANQTDRVFHIGITTTNITVEMSGLTVTGGQDEQ